MFGSEYYKYPRLYTEERLKENGQINLSRDHLHYLRNVMRRKEGDFIRLFNGQDGEWLCAVQKLDKKNGVLGAEKHLRPQSDITQRTHLVFAPLKKDRMNFLIEKSVELGVTDFHPVLTDRTEVRKINEGRLTQQIIEASEQSERLDVPALHDLQHRDVFISGWNSNIPLICCIERGGHKNLAEIIGNPKPREAAFLIGPVGGFTDDEIDIFTADPHIQTASLGPNVLRSETAAIAPLVYMLLST